MSTMKSFNVKDKGSNYPFNRESPKAKDVPRSLLPLSYLNTFTADLGQLLPFYTQFSLPNEDYGFNVEAVIRVVNPPTVPLLSRQRAYFHMYWLSFNQLWRYGKIFFDRGRLTMTPPENIVIPTFNAVRGEVAERGSLYDMLGFNVVNRNSDDETQSVAIPALKFMAYLKIWRDYYCNKRIFSAWLKRMYANTGLDWYRILGEFLFPADEDDFRIGSSQWEEFAKSADCMKFFTEIKYRNWTDDYFTTMQMTPLYADETPSIDFGAVSDKVQSQFYSKISGYPNGYNIPNSDIGRVDPDVDFGFYQFNNVPFGDSPAFAGLSANDSGSKKIVTPDTDLTFRTPDGSAHIGSGYTIVGALNHSIGIESTSSLRFKSSLTIDMLRNCMAETAILEKLAKTDGTYGEYVRAMFGESPRSAYDMRPVFVGGTYQPIVYSSVVSNVANKENETVKPQGSITGLGLSSAEGFCGRHHSDDYGLYVGIMSIMPDTYYCQGLQREDTYKTPEDFYLPERANLGMQAVMQSELYNTIGSDDVVLGYQNRYDELRYRANEVHGKVADDENESFSPYVQTRIFHDTPTLSPELLTTKDNISKKWLSGTEEVPFIVQLANKVRAVRIVPYKAVPTTFGM